MSPESYVDPQLAQDKLAKVPFYNPDLRVEDPIFLHRALYDLEFLRTGAPRPDGPEKLVTVGDPHTAVLATSIYTGPLMVNEEGGHCHMPCFDIDIPFKDMKVVQSASGNCHLYINKPMRYEQMMHLMQAMVQAGLVQKGYAQACMDQKMARLRMPGVVKHGGGRAKGYGYTQE